MRQRTWLGRTQVPLATWILGGNPSTERAVRAGVILCSPVGQEQVISYRTLRQLAERLADLGFVVLRFDWSGTGDSAPRDPDLDLVENWQADLRELVATLRSWGVDSVNLVGLGLGALLAGSMLEELAPLNAAVLLDPPESGKRYLRRQRALAATLDAPVPCDENRYGPGITFYPADVAALTRLTAASIPRDTTRVAWVRRAAGNPASGNEAQSRHGQTGDQTSDEWYSDEFEAALDRASLLSVVPSVLLDQVCVWLDRNNPLDKVALNMPEMCTEIEISKAGKSVRESFVELPGGLPAVLTEPSAAGSAVPPGNSMPPVLLVPPASEPMSAPVSLWSIAARRLAYAGATVLRFDKRGTGELGGPGRTDTDPFVPGYVDDVAAAGAWLTERSGLAPMGAGLCSGAYLLGLPEAARTMAKIVAFNIPCFDADPDRIPLAQRQPLSAQPVELIAMAPEARHSANWRRWLKHHLPQPLWQMLSMLGLVRSPDRYVRDLARLTDASLVLSPADGAHAIEQRVPQAIARAHAEDRVRLRLDQELDHPAFTPQSRERILQILAEEYADLCAVSAPATRANPRTGG